MGSGFGYLEFSRGLVLLALGLNVLVVGLVLVGYLLRDRRFVLGARNALIAAGVVITGAACGLIAGFLAGAYDREYIFNYSERGLPLGYKIAGLWAGLDGSILFWAMLLGILSAIVAIQYRREERHPVGRQLEPHVYLVLSVVQLFFLVVIGFVADPFSTLQDVLGADFARRFPHGIPADGAGLNPLLVNYWMQIHPPSLYVGWVIYTIPFAYGIAALIAGEQGGYWIRKVRRWTLIGWLFNTSGLIMGGLWAYEVLGWGGYWAWDPVENASFLPWFSSTAFLHSVMVQERRDMLRSWNAFLVALTFFLSIFGTYLTRSGIVSSVHAFASGEVGNWFLGFLLLVAFASLFLLAFRYRDLRSPHRIENVLSREAIFVLNNMILIATAASIVILTLWPKISQDFFHRAITVSVPVYNMVTLPQFAVLLFLTAIGPGMGWISTTRRNLARNFAASALVSLPLAAAVQWLMAALHGGEDRSIPWSEHIYPAGIFNYLSWFIIITLLLEVWRTAGSRASRRGEGMLASFMMISMKNNRRYGGYLVHVGMALLCIGVVSSSVFKVTRKEMMREGETRDIGRYEVTLKRSLTDPGGPVYGIHSLEIELRKDSRTVATLLPEKRRYHKREQVVTEVAIHQFPLEDFYLYFDAAEKTDAEGGDLYDLTFYRNPLIGLVWLGWLTMIAGGLWAALPMGRRRVGLSD
ncbi:MAG: heme lyase CcmF/NrfE family subunit [Planctomycetota bacterium]